MNVRSKILKIRNLPKGDKRIDHVHAKPYVFISICLAIGIGLLCTRFFLAGIIVTLIFLFYLIFVRDMILIEIYDQYAVFYFINEKDECFLLFWEDIEKWEVINSRTDLDVLNITLHNHEMISLKCLSKKKVIKYFVKYTNEEQQKVTKQHML